MILTSDNISNKLVLAGCCLADLAVNYVASKNIGDDTNAQCYFEKMKKIVFARKALCQFYPASELTPHVELTGFSGGIGDTVTVFVNGVQISDTVTKTGSTELLGVMLAASINTYSSDYTATYDSTGFFLYSTTTGTEQNGYEVTYEVTGSIDPDPVELAGGLAQWCLTDTQANKIIGLIDSICGCPCGCNENITNDTLPKYIN